MPYSLQCNHTPGIGFQAIVEIYDDVLEVPTGFPADLILGECSRDAGIEHKWDNLTLDRTAWKYIFGYNDDDLVPCLRHFLEHVSGLTPERIDELIIEIEVRLATDRIGENESDFDEFYYDSDVDDGDTIMSPFLLEVGYSFSPAII